MAEGKKKMINIDNKEKCCGCTACASSCPKKCIKMTYDSEGFIYPNIDIKMCINCGLCEKVCPFNNKIESKTLKASAFAAKCKNESVRQKSSSGGIFSLFAKYIISESGSVYGVSMNNACDLAEHIRVIHEDGLEKLRGSKYLQSDLRNTFRLVKEDLIEGKYVLFSGTPCQISGLSRYLGKKYDNLFLVEIICHGTPSVAFWRKYKEHLEKKNKLTITSVNFRKKRNVWNDFEYPKNGSSKYVFNSQFEDPYLIMFLKDICLRPSCYKCVSKSTESNADLTIGDYWGAKEDVPDMDDDKGLSIVFVQTEKGKQLLGKIENDCFLTSANFDNAIKHNKSYYESVKRPEQRTTFYVDLERLTFAKMRKKYANTSIRSRIRQSLKKTTLFRILKRMQGVTKAPFEYGLLVEMKKD